MKTLYTLKQVCYTKYQELENIAWSYETDLYCDIQIVWSDCLHVGGNNMKALIHPGLWFRLLVVMKWCEGYQMPQSTRVLLLTHSISL